MKNRKIVIVLILLLSLFININVFAIPEEMIIVNGDDAVEITAGGEYPGATYDSTTKTLTLNNYSGDYILLDFPDGDTVNIVLKGNNNIIHAGGYASGDTIGLGVDNSNTKELNINITGETGSKLNINGYFNGIYVQDGNISINNANISFDDVEGKIIYSMNGDKIDINHSNITCESYFNYGISGDEANITFNNSSFVSNDMIDGEDEIFGGKSFEFNDSNFDFYTIGTFANFKYPNDLTLNNCDINIYSADVLLKFDESGGNLTLKNCNIDLDSAFKFVDNVLDITIEDNTTINVEFIISFLSTSESLLIKDSTIEVDEAFLFISVYEVDIINSRVTLHYGNGDDSDFLSGAISSSSINIEKSNVDITNKFFGIFGVELNIDESTVHLKSTNSVALCLNFYEEPLYTLKNAYLTETNYQLYTTEYDETPILSYFSEKPNDSYEADEIMDLMSLAAPEIHIVPESNPNTFDVSVLYIIIGILSIIGISIAKFDLDLLKSNK